MCKLYAQTATKRNWIDKKYRIEALASNKLETKRYNSKFLFSGCQVYASKEYPENINPFNCDGCTIKIVKGEDELFHIILVNLTTGVNSSEFCCKKEDGFQVSVYSYFYDETEFGVFKAPSGLSEYYRVQILVSKKKLTPYEINKLKAILKTSDEMLIDIIDSPDRLFSYMLPKIIPPDRIESEIDILKRDLKRYPDLKPVPIRYGSAEIRLPTNDDVMFKKTPKPTVKKKKKTKTKSK
jgi:hypothetical protein